MALNESMVAKGSQFPTGAVIEQSEATSANGTNHNARLVDSGLPPDTVTKLKNAAKAVVLARGSQTGTRGESKNATTSEGTSRADGKKVIRRMKNVAKIVLRNGPVAGIKLEQFKLGEVGATTKDVLDYLAKLRPLVLSLDEQFKPLLKNQSAVATVDNAISALTEIAGTQEAKRKSAPLETLALYEAQGNAVDLIEQINNYAQIAFEDEPAIRALFNKDILLRSRRGSRKNSAENTAASPPATPSTTSPKDTPTSG